MLAFLFRLSKWKCVLIMIAANYFSAWVGDLFILGYAIKTPELDLYNAWNWVRSMVAVTFLITLVLEWPFVFFCLRKSESRLKKSLWGNFVIQLLSYVLVFGWYYRASQKTLYTEMHVVKPVEFSASTNGVVYFISTNGDLYSMNPAGASQKKIADSVSTNHHDRLFVRQNEAGATGIFVRTYFSSDTNSVRCVFSNLQMAATAPKTDQKNAPNEVDEYWLGEWDVARLGSASNSVWEFHTGSWAADGLEGENHKTGQKLHLAFETPFEQWWISCAYHLPGDYILFQLGSNQICIFDPNTKRVALLAKGYGPVVMLE